VTKTYFDGSVELGITRRWLVGVENLIFNLVNNVNRALGLFGVQLDLQQVHHTAFDVRRPGSLFTIKEDVVDLRN